MAAGAPGGPIYSLKLALRGDPRDSGLRAVSRFMLKGMKDAFNNQGRSGSDWPPRAVPNRIGILLDMRQGVQRGNYVTKKRWQPRPAGFDTGDLYRSLFSEVDGNIVRWGSREDYAHDFAVGGIARIEITADMRLAFKSRVFNKWGSIRRKDLRDALMGIIDQPYFETRVPPRNFAVPNDYELTMARKIFVNEFIKAGGLLSQHGYGGF